MKLTKSILKEMIEEEILTERLKRFKVYVSGESEPLVLMGKDIKDVKHIAHQMIQNSSVKIKKVVKEGKLTEGNPYGLTYKKGKTITVTHKTSGKELVIIDKPNVRKEYEKIGFFTEGKKKNLKVEDWSSEKQPYSSKEAKSIMDSSLKDYARDLRKVQYRVIKDWMSKAKAGVIDYFDVHRGLTRGDASRANPYETEFLRSVLEKDKIIDRFRKYFGGKKGKRRN